jgi:tRNA-dihydrouridine synthase 4
MILADSFIKSPKARASEFATNKHDKPLIVQFAANNVDDFVSASEMIAP